MVQDHQVRWVVEAIVAYCTENCLIRAKSTYAPLEIQIVEHFSPTCASFETPVKQA